MSENGMPELKVNHLEIMARAWAGTKAREIAGIVTDNVLNQTGATVPDLALIHDAEVYTERFLTAWLKNCTVEFVGEYERAIEERVDRLERMLNDYVNMTPNPPTIIKP